MTVPGYARIGTDMARTPRSCPPRALTRWTQGRSQESLAAELGCSQQTVSRILAGGEPSLGLKLVIRRKAGVPLDAWPTPEVVSEADLAPLGVAS